VAAKSNYIYSSNLFSTQVAIGIWICSCNYFQNGETIYCISSIGTWPRIQATLN